MIKDELLKKAYLILLIFEYKKSEFRYLNAKILINIYYHWIRLLNILINHSNYYNCI